VTTEREMVLSIKNGLILNEKNKLIGLKEIHEKHIEFYSEIVLGPWFAYCTNLRWHVNLSNEILCLKYWRRENQEVS
jgi:hypothetical protein